MSAPESGSFVLRVAFMGTPEAAVPTLRAVAAAGHGIPLVITRPDRRRGRGKRLAPAPVKAAALELGLDIFHPEDVNDRASVARLVEAEPDVLLVVAYGRILKRRVFTVPRLLPMNLHFSLLPEFRGAAPVAAAIAAGRTRTGVTLQRLVAKLDSGPVLAAEETRIRPDETAGELEARLARIGADLTVRTLPGIARGEVEEVPQDESRVSFAPMLVKRDGRVDWTRGAAAIACHIRAMDPWPGAQAVFSGRRRAGEIRVVLGGARAVPEEAPDAAPGEVVTAGRSEIVVATGEGLLGIARLTPAGKRELSGREFSNGYHVEPGDRFRTP